MESFQKNVTAWDQKQRQKAPAGSDEVNELRQQLRQLTDELHLLRKNLRTVPDNLLSIRQCSAALSVGNLNEYANSDQLKPPLPPRLYRPPPKPQRTFQQESPEQLIEHSDLPIFGFRGPILPVQNGLGSHTAPCAPPKVPPKSPNVKDKMRPQGFPSVVQWTKDTNFLFKATPVLLNQEKSGLPRGIQTNGSITPPRYAIPVGNGMDRERTTVKGGSNWSLDPNSVGNLASLGEPLNENSLIRELESNFSTGICWQNLGPVSLFLNPFNDLGSPCTLSEVRDAPKPLQSLAQELHSAFHTSDTSQSVVFCGERCSGKTYLSMQLIRELFRAFGGIGAVEAESFTSLSAAVTVSRSLARSKTGDNPNGSQIGFLYELHIADGVPCKSKLYCCFTDLKRIVTRKPNDGNFHIFYEMLAGLTPEEKGKFHLHMREEKDFAYLRSATCVAQRGDVGKDRIQFSRWKAALSQLGIPFSDVIRLMAAVLLLGNVCFEESKVDHGEVEMTGQRGTFVFLSAVKIWAGTLDLEAVAALLGLSGISLYKALTRRVRHVKGHQINAVSSATVANCARDALARTLYYRCVSAIIRRANSVRSSSNRNGNTTSSGISSSDGESSVHDSGIGLTPTGRVFNRMTQSSAQNGDGLIAVLDLFGFSNFEENVFEDLCANAVCEKLQRFYQSQLQRSQQVLSEENVDMLGLEFNFRPRNDCLDFLLSPRSGLLSLLDEESSNPHGSVEKFLLNLKHQQTSNKAIGFSDATSNSSFILHHYSGVSVTYNAAEFVLLNRDEVPSELLRVFGKQSCNFGFAAYLFSTDVSQLENLGQFRDRNPHSRIIPSCGADVLSTGHSLVSFSQDFAHQVDTFLKSIGSTRVRFVHCVKPNMELEYRRLDPTYVLQQIRRLDILPTAQLLSAGLPYCVSFDEFNNRYRFLAIRYQQDSDFNSESSEETKMILDCYLKAVDDSNMPYISNQWVLGTKHIFLSQGAHDQLESLRRSSSLLTPSPAVSSWLSKNCAKYGESEICQNNARLETIAQGCEVNGETVRRTTRQFENQAPPPLPAPRRYSVFGDRKVNFPQRRIMTESYTDEDAGADFRSGDVVTVVGNSNRCKHLIVDMGPGKTCSVPSTYTKLSVK